MEESGHPTVLKLTFTGPAPLTLTGHSPILITNSQWRESEWLFFRVSILPYLVRSFRTIEVGSFSTNLATSINLTVAVLGAEEEIIDL